MSFTARRLPFNQLAKSNGTILSRSRSLFHFQILAVPPSGPDVAASLLISSLPGTNET